MTLTRRGFLGALGAAAATIALPTPGEIARFGDPDRAFWRPGKKHLFLDDTKAAMLSDREREKAKKLLVSSKLFTFRGRIVSIVSGIAEGHPIRTSEWANVKVMDIRTCKITKVAAAEFARHAVERKTPAVPPRRRFA